MAHLRGYYRNGLSGKFTLISSLPLVEELFRVLKNFRIPLKTEKIELLENIIFEKSIIVVPTEKVDIIKDDPDDNKFIEAALEGKADYIVSQDKHLLDVKVFRDVKIATPKEFLEMLNLEK